MKQYLLPEDIRAALIEYLQKRPYEEVAQGISALLSLVEQDIRPLNGDTKKS